jgi:hypothetical protein
MVLLHGKWKTSALPLLMWLHPVAGFQMGVIGNINSIKSLACFIGLFALIILFEFFTGFIDFM